MQNLKLNQINWTLAHSFIYDLIKFQMQSCFCDSLKADTSWYTANLGCNLNSAYFVAFLSLFKKLLKLLNKNLLLRWVNVWMAAVEKRFILSVLWSCQGWHAPTVVKVKRTDFYKKKILWPKKKIKVFIKKKIFYVEGINPWSQKVTHTPDL